MKNGILAVLAVIGTTIANWLGGWDTALIVLVFMMAIDFVTGLAVALIFKKSPKTESGGASSCASWKGIAKKVCVLILVGIGAMLDRVLHADYVRNLVVIFYIGSEGLSVLENIGLMGVPFPSFIKKALEVLKSKGDSGEE